MRTYVCFLKVNHARKTYINCKVPPYRTPHTRTQMVFVLTASNWTSQTIVASWSCMIWHWWSRINNCTWNVYVTNVWLNYNLFYNVFELSYCAKMDFPPFFKMAINEFLYFWNVLFFKTFTKCVFVLLKLTFFQNCNSLWTGDKAPFEEADDNFLNFSFTNSSSKLSKISWCCFPL